MSAIKPGDMVRIVFGACEHSRKLIGVTATVVKVERHVTECNLCGQHTSPNTLAALMRGHTGKLGGMPVSWLIRIDPPAKTLETEREKELTS